MCWVVASRLWVCGQMSRMEYIGGRKVCKSGVGTGGLVGLPRPTILAGVGVTEVAGDRERGNEACRSGIASFMLAKSAELLRAASLK